nr:ribbon-helix-helix domain-containing protein [Moraxella sp. CTOTU47915]
MTDKKTADKKSVALTVRLDENLVNEFKRACAEKDYSQSFVIRELIKRYLADNKQRDLFR